MTTRFRVRRMRLVAGFPIITIAIALSGGITQLQAAQDPKLEICHVPDDGQPRLLSISSNAEKAHRGHGDALPGEPVPYHATLKFDAECHQVPIRVEGPLLTCPCWNTYTQSALVGLLNAVPVTGRDCSASTTAVSLSPDFSTTTWVYANNLSACILQLGGEYKAMFFSLTREQAGQCMVEAASLMAGTSWCQ